MIKFQRTVSLQEVLDEASEKGGGFVSLSDDGQRNGLSYRDSSGNWKGASFPSGTFVNYLKGGFDPMNGDPEDIFGTLELVFRDRRNRSGITRIEVRLTESALKDLYESSRRYFDKEFTEAEPTELEPID